MYIHGTKWTTSLILNNKGRGMAQTKMFTIQEFELATKKLYACMEMFIVFKFNTSHF